MKKLVFFLLLLGLGVLVLYLLDRPPASVEGPPAPEPDQPAGTGQSAVRLQGRFRATLYDAEARAQRPGTEKALLTIESEDSRTDQEGDVFSQVLLEILDPLLEGVVQSRLRARSARVQRLDAGGDYRPLYENRVLLEEVQAQILAGLPLAPLEFQAPQALVDARDPKARRVESATEFRASSPELTATGRGLQCELDRGVLEVRERGRIEFSRAPGERAVFAATGSGPLQIRREGGPGGPLVLEAWQGVRLEPGGAASPRLTAEHVTVRALPASTDPSGRLAIERLEAEGEVEWRSGDALFRAQRASASFAPDGRLLRARLEGLPSAELELELTPDVLPEVEATERRQVVVRGQKALDITWEQGFRMQIEGPASVETRDFRLRSAIGVQGWLAEDERSARFQASGGVVVESGRATLETQDFEVAIGTDEQGGTTLSGTASGGARLAGTLEDGRPYTLTSPEGLSIERTARGWRVIDGRAVEISLEGADGFRARADRVRDFTFSQQGFRFQAEGGIVFENALGRFGGEKLDLTALEPMTFRLEGTRERKAFHEGAGRRASALLVEAAGASWHARGEVEGSWELAPEESAEVRRLELATEELFVDRSDAPGALPEETLRTWHGTAQGGAQASIVSSRGTSIVRGARLAFDQRQRLIRGQERPVELGLLVIAEQDVHADVFVRESELVLDCQRVELETEGADQHMLFRQLTASGDVRFLGRGQLAFGGEGEVLTYEQDGQGSLQGPLYGEVQLYGKLPSHDLPFRLGAERVDFSSQEPRWIRAVRPELRVSGHRARAEQLSADERLVELTGGVRVSGATRLNVPWTLEAGQVTFLGRAPDEQSTGQLDSFQARDGVVFQLARRAEARGRSLSARRATGVLRLEGSPGSVRTNFGLFEAEWLEFDPVLAMLVATGPGRMRSLPETTRAPPANAPADAAPPAQEPRSEWTLDFLSSSTLVELDSLVLVVQEPTFEDVTSRSQLRASWAIFWLDREGMRDLEAESDMLASLKQTFEALSGGDSGDVSLTQILEMFRTNQLSGLQREVYFEGPVEVLAEGEVLARADALYLDTVSKHGWLARATVNLVGRYLGRDEQRLVVKTDWLRLSNDGSLRADRATVTSCTYDDPHVRVVTGDLRIQPLESGGEEHFRLLLKENRIELFDWLRVPLPAIDVNTDEEFNLLWPTLSVADSARFGTFLGLTFTRPADKVGAVFNEAVGHEEDDVDAHYKVDGSYLGSRGGLLDLGLEIESKQNYWFDLYLGLAYDDGQDRGFIRVDEDDRDTLRRWLRSQSYFENGKSAWSLAITDQSDPAVQSEFFESQFLRYEQSETYGQWRRSSDEYFTQAAVKVRTDGFRSDVEELPSLSAYRSRSPILSLGKFPLVHAGDVRADYLRRRQGSEPRSPFALPTEYPDGLEEREVLRVDTTQALELPLPVGWAGLKLTPFVSARGTAWNEGQEESDSPTRLLVEGGARLATTFWKRAANGALHQLAPFLEYRNELELSEHDGQPVAFDSTELTLSGDFLRLGARTRLGAAEGASRFDLDLVGTHASGRSDGAADGWLPLEVFSRLDVRPFGKELEFWYDARLDLENSETVYSLFSVATRLGDSWGVQAGHQFGRALDGSAAGGGIDVDPSRPVLFEAATVSAIYRWTERWEFEGRQAFSLLEDEELDTKIVLRRYGHDIVFEIDSSVREGEGSSFGISVRPRFGYHPPRIGYVPW